MWERRVELFQVPARAVQAQAAVDGAVCAGRFRDVSGTVPRGVDRFHGVRFDCVQKMAGVHGSV